MDVWIFLLLLQDSHHSIVVKVYCSIFIWWHFGCPLVIHKSEYVFQTRSWFYKNFIWVDWKMAKIFWKEEKYDTKPPRFCTFYLAMFAPISHPPLPVTLAHFIVAHLSGGRTSWNSSETMITVFTALTGRTRTAILNRYRAPSMSCLLIASIAGITTMLHGLCVRYHNLVPQPQSDVHCH